MSLIVGRRIAVFLVRNALEMVGNGIYDKLSASIDDPKSSFKYSPVTEYSILSKSTPELNFQTVQYFDKQTNQTYFGLGWQFKVLIISPIKYTPDFDGTVWFETDWGTSSMDPTQYMCVRNQQSKDTTYKIVVQKSQIQPGNNAQVASETSTYQIKPSTIYPKDPNIVKNNQNDIGLTGKLLSIASSSGKQIFDFSCHGLRLDNYLQQVQQNQSVNFVQYGYEPLRIGGQFNFKMGVQIQLPQSSEIFFSETFNSNHVILAAATFLIKSCVAAALIIYIL